ncbi:PX domain-containing protein [Phytophthora infestans]|uniref:PX domain-containing protein n=1 Tax=Phytophthora infestans TaxID=4787 RepID=A0A833SWX3_PHYIN|nr:PX domain-containing protein [Phytophthora infestans]
MMIPEYSPRGTSITYRNATAVPPMVYRLSLKPASPSPPSSPTASAATPTTPTATAIVYVQSRPTIPSSSSTGTLVATGSFRRARRRKSHSESALRLERMLAPAPLGGVLALTISGYSKNNHGTWMFKVDVGGPSDSNAYVVRRRFTDFKLLHEGLSELSELPELPPHGIVSVFQMFVSPDKLLTTRAERLQEMLLVIHAHPTLYKSKAFSSFIGKNPSSYDTGYVSLSGYEVPASQRPSPAGSFDTSFSV